MVIFSCHTQWQENEKMKKNFLSFLILIIYQFCSKFIADYESLADAPEEYNKEIRNKWYRIKEPFIHIAMSLHIKLALPIIQDETIKNLININLFSKLIISAPEPPSHTAEQIRKAAQNKSYPKIQSIFF